MMRERSGWRELDSNHRSRGRPRRSRGIGSRLRRLSVGGESSRADMSPSRNLLSRGTDGSNPASSSKESAANLTSSIRARSRPSSSSMPNCTTLSSRFRGRGTMGAGSPSGCSRCSPERRSRSCRVRHIRPRASAVIPVGRPRPPARRSAQGGVGGMTASRRLAAVLATDVAGYSRQSAALRAPRSENQRTSSPHRQDHGRRHAGGIRERRRCAGRSRCSRQCPGGTLVSR
jgi:hypothetical protein